MPQSSPFLPIAPPRSPGPPSAETPLGSVAEPAGAVEKKNEQAILFAVLLALVGVVIWAYDNTLFGKRGITIAWDNPQYSYGWLIPLFSVVLLFLRREPIGKVSSGERWAGVGLIALSTVLRIAATWSNINTVDMGSMVPMLLGVFLLVGGWRTLRWAGPPIAFLVFMYPLPMFVERQILMPMKTVATVSSTFVLQTMGLDAFNEGNLIKLRDQQLEVADACSGLRMLTIFFALAVAMAMVTGSPWWEQIVLVASAAPIAILVNIIRIVATGILYVALGKEIDMDMYHKVAGLCMIPLATGFLYLEIIFLSHLWIDEDAEPVRLAESPVPSRGLPI